MKKQALICRGCDFWISGIACAKRRSYKTCEKMRVLVDATDAGYWKMHTHEYKQDPDSFIVDRFVCECGHTVTEI